jgi:hypothetical protein
MHLLITKKEQIQNRKERNKFNGRTAEIVKLYKVAQMFNYKRNLLKENLPLLKQLRIEHHLMIEVLRVDLNQWLLRRINKILRITNNSINKNF